jgi:pimeloyl-ACP methyl ester carboxylesterase
VNADPALQGPSFVLDDPRAGKVQVYARAEHTDHAPMLLVHSVNAAGSAFEVRPLYEHYVRSRPTYAIDLPGFGMSDRSDRVYDPRLMTDAVLAAVREIRRRHSNARVDALALSLASEFLARAANEAPDEFASLALVSPTGFSGKQRRAGPEGSTRHMPGFYAILDARLWSNGLYGLLTKPSVVRYFLERTFGSDRIDEEMWAYDVRTTRQPGAKNAPLYFLSGNLFSDDIDRLYDSLSLPVWISHGVRGDFVDYRKAKRMRTRSNWHFTVFETGALPHFEELEKFVAAYDAFLVSARASETR